jgi:hypothetical protein
MHRFYVRGAYTGWANSPFFNGLLALGFAYDRIERTCLWLPLRIGTTGVQPQDGVGTCRLSRAHPELAGLETGRADSVTHAADVEVVSWRERHSHDVALQVYGDCGDAIQASQGVCDALGSRQSLHAEAFNPQRLCPAR